MNLTHTKKKLTEALVVVSVAKYSLVQCEGSDKNVQNSQLPVTYEAHVYVPSAASLLLPQGHAAASERLKRHTGGQISQFSKHL